MPLHYYSPAEMAGVLERFTGAHPKVTVCSLQRDEPKESVPGSMPASVTPPGMILAQLLNASAVKVYTSEGDQVAVPTIGPVAARGLRRMR